MLETLETSALPIMGGEGQRSAISGSEGGSSVQPGDQATKAPKALSLNAAAKGRRVHDLDGSTIRGLMTCSWVNSS
jgi:hypothetical protein